MGLRKPLQQDPRLYRHVARLLHRLFCRWLPARRGDEAEVITAAKLVNVKINDVKLSNNVGGFWHKHETSNERSLATLVPQHARQLASSGPVCGQNRLKWTGATISYRAYGEALRLFEADPAEELAGGCVATRAEECLLSP